MRILLPTVALLLAAAAAWTLYAPESAEENPGRIAHGAADRERAPTLAPGAHLTDRGAAPTPSDEPTVPALDSDLPAWGLAIDVEPGKGSTPADCAGIEVEAALRGPGETALFVAAATTDAAGRCRIGPIDLPPVPRRFGRTVRLEVRTLHPDLLTHPWVRWPAVLARAIRAEAGEGVRWLPVTLSPERGRVIHGRLLTATGHPVGGVPVFTKRYTGFDDSDWDGVFSVRFDPKVTVVKVEIAGCFELQWETRMPAWEDADEEMVIRLPDERHVSGRVLDVEGRPQAGIQLVLAPPSWDPNGGIVLLPSSFYALWTKKRLQTRSAPDGTFAFPGLIRGDAYVLWWPGDDDRWHRYERDVYADDAGLEIRLERHRFVVDCVDAVTGLPVHGTSRVERVLEDGTFRPLRMSDAEPAEEGTIAAPGDRFRILAWAQGYAFVESEYVVPAEAGVHRARVEMPPLVPAPRVDLRCVDQEGQPLGPVPLKFCRPLEKRRDFDLEPRTTEEIDGHSTTGLPPGPVHVSTKPYLGHPPEGRWRFTLGATAALEVPVEGPATFDVVCRQGGALRLVIESPDGSKTPTGPVRARGPNGGAPNVWWYENERGDRWDITLWGDRAWTPGDKALESQALGAGSWTLRVEGGEAWHDVERTVRLESGRVTEIRILLEPR